MIPITKEDAWKIGSLFSRHDHGLIGKVLKQAETGVEGNIPVSEGGIEESFLFWLIFEQQCIVVISQAVTCLSCEKLVFSIHFGHDGSYFQLKKVG